MLSFCASIHIHYGSLHSQPYYFPATTVRSLPPLQRLFILFYLIALFCLGFFFVTVCLLFVCVFVSYKSLTKVICVTLSLQIAVDAWQDHYEYIAKYQLSPFPRIYLLLIVDDPVSFFHSWLLGYISCGPMPVCVAARSSSSAQRMIFYCLSLHLLTLLSYSLSHKGVF